LSDPTDPCCTVGYPRKAPPVPCDDDPLPDGVADPGVSLAYSRCDHVHPAAAAGGSKAAKMRYVLDRTAAQGTGNEPDIVCIDGPTGLAFTPKWIHVKLHSLGGASSGGSSGDAMMTDGNTIGRQQCIYCRDGSNLSYDNTTVVAAGLSSANVGFILTLIASGAAGNVRLAWTIINGGATMEGIAIIEGDLA